MTVYYELLEHECGEEWSVTPTDKWKPIGKFYDKQAALLVVCLLNREIDHDAWLVRLKEEVDIWPDE